MLLLAPLLLVACDAVDPSTAPVAPVAPEADVQAQAYTKQQLEAQVVALSRQVAALQTSLRSLDGRVQVLEGSDRELWAGLEQVQVGGIQALTARVDATDVTVSDLSARFQALDGAGLPARVGAVEATIRPFTNYDDADWATVASLTATVAELHRVDDDMDIAIAGLQAATRQHGVVPVADDSDTFWYRIGAQERTTCVQDEALRATLGAELIPCGDAICVRTATGDVIWRQWADAQLLGLDAATCAP